MNAAQLFVKCLENEDVKTIFGIPGEENLDVMDALLDSDIEFITTRHEQGAAFMADVYGRLTGKAGVCLATLGPGATNLVTGFADANMDRAAIVAIAGQAATTRLHKESHQVLDLVGLFKPISKFATQVLQPDVVPEIVRKAFKVAQAEKPGGCFIEFPEDIAAMTVGNKLPLKMQSAQAPVPPLDKTQQAAQLINAAKRPIILVGNGVIRANASAALQQFAEQLNIPVTNTFMAKGVLAFSHPLSLGTVGLQANDYISYGLQHADLIICIGFDMVEYHPQLWHKNLQTPLLHIDESPAEVDEYYIVAAGVIGHIAEGLAAIAANTKPKADDPVWQQLRQLIVKVMQEHAHDNAYPVKPQKLLWDVRQVLAAEDIIISDVGAHKMWIARMFQAEAPNTCIISNGFASMGIAVPGAIAAKHLYPERTVIAMTGDAGFLMNCQEIETAMRIGAPIIILIWNDSEYGLIKWKQQIHFGRESHIKFTNPDFIKFAESFGAKGYRIERTEDFIPTLKQAIADNTVVLIDCPIDYRENLKLTQQLNDLVDPLKKA